jgi:hypothetical protein
MKSYVFKTQVFNEVFDSLSEEMILPKYKRSSNFVYKSHAAKENKLKLIKGKLNQYRSRSLEERVKRETPSILRRTLSDFHECPMVKLNLSIELFSGVNQFNKIGKWERTNAELRNEGSVSDELSSNGNQYFLMFRKRII